MCISTKTQVPSTFHSVNNISVIPKEARSCRSEYMVRSARLSRTFTITWE